MAAKEIKYKDKIFDISYTLLNPSQEKDIVLLHGWGVNKELMQRAFGRCFGDYRHIYIDMPGFGGSSNELVLDSFDYKNILELFLKELNSSKDIILGHSFGGKIALLLEPKILVLLSSAGIVVKKPFLVKVKIRVFKMLKKIGLGGVYKIFASKDVEGMSQNMYETFKKVVDEDFLQEFSKFEGRALIFWGKDDKATPLESGKKIASSIKNSSFYELKGDHFFFLKHKDFICDKIEHLE